MTVVLVDPRRASLVPVEAVALLAGDVQYTEEMPIRVPWSLPASRPAYDGEDAPVLLSSDPDHPMVKARLAAGEKLISAPPPQPGERLVDAVAIMDTLRTAGPWEREQTHESLRRYLLEETYELFDAIRSRDTAELRDELGDLLLQVLFHARIAQDATGLTFGIDDVADALVRKLRHRAPAVLAGEEISLDDQLAQWEERKALEGSVKARASAMDDVPTGQPAMALTQKVYQRIIAAGLPVDLIPAGLVTIGTAFDGDAENVLRAQALAFIDTVRKVECDIADSRRDPDVPVALDATVLGEVTEAEWRAHWPVAELPDPDLPDADLPDADLSSAELPDAELPDADLPDADLSSVELLAKSDPHSAINSTLGEGTQDSSVEPQ